MLENTMNNKIKLKCAAFRFDITMDIDDFVLSYQLLNW